MCPGSRPAPPDPRAPPTPCGGSPRTWRHGPPRMVPSPSRSRCGRWGGGRHASGRRAFLTHRSGADAWGQRASHRRNHEVTSAGRGREHPRIDVHRCRLSEDDVTELRGVPITTPARTLLDLAEVVPFEHLRRALERTHHLDLFDGRAIEGVLSRAGNRRGRSRLDRAMELFRPEHADVASRLETLALRLVEQAGLPRP